MAQITLGSYKIRVSSDGKFRFVNRSDAFKMLGFKSETGEDWEIEASFITNTLFKKVYETKNATLEEKAILRGLCVVGIHPLIDEACRIDLRGTKPYLVEFNQLLIKKPMWSLS